MPHDFDAALRLAPQGDHRFAGATHPAYANMVGPYGGVTAAVLLNAALQHPQRLGDPIALTVNFAAPLADGGFEVEARPVRTNRSTQHWQLTLTQGGEAAATGTAVFAARRDTWSAPEAEFPADMPAAAGLARLSGGGAPPWTQRYDMRFAPGEAPRLDGRLQPHSRSRLWVRDEPPRPLDFASLAAICDCFFPRIFVRRGQPAPIGTVSLTCFFHADAALLAAQGERHLLGCARGLNFRRGYFDQSAEVWSDDGQLLASTHQMVYYRE
ncbi:MAG: thioesterase family protein [Roseateles sp.]|uniref:acyl-CoA thioesterase n=1 Tax=Roseateles sp. TaxID=1971397 RepID=UPI0039E74316